MPKIEKIEGIGPAYAAKLATAGVTTTAQLLKIAGGKKGREELAAKADVPEKLVLEWVNRADLMRVKGVGEQFSDLLELAGVDTVKELRTRNAENLTAAMKKVNAERKAVRRVPTLGEVTRWIEFAKTLEPAVTH